MLRDSWHSQRKSTQPSNVYIIIMFQCIIPESFDYSTVLTELIAIQIHCLHLRAAWRWNNNNILTHRMAHQLLTQQFTLWNILLLLSSPWTTHFCSFHNNRLVVPKNYIISITNPVVYHFWYLHIEYLIHINAYIYMCVLLCV